MLRWLFVSWIANAVALGVAALVLGGVDVSGSAGTLFVAALVFAVAWILSPLEEKLLRAQASDFGFKFEFGYCSKEQFDSFAGTWTIKRRAPES